MLFFSALREKIKSGYSSTDLKSDLLSGLVVSLVAIPLAMALAIATGVPPQNGLYTVIIAGTLVGLMGGSRFQVTGPTAAFIVILAPIVQSHGLEGLLTAGILAGLILFLMGLGRMGQLIQYIPYPVTTGFTSGIAIVICISQFKDFFGIQLESVPLHFIEKAHVLLLSLPSLQIPDTFIALMTLVILLVWPKVNKSLPSPLIALAAASFAVFIMHLFMPELKIETIGSRFGNIPNRFPTFSIPWTHFELNFLFIKSIFPSAFAIALLGAIESLLSAVVADGMTQTKHNPNGELVSLGVANMVGPFFGAIPATGAIARTATNIRFGAHSNLSAFFHGVFTLLGILLFAQILSYIPMAALASLLVLVAYNMSEAKHFIHILKVAPRSDIFVLLTCFSLTVFFDMVIGVGVGIVLAALLLMKRISELTRTDLIEEHHSSLPQNQKLPQDVVLYQIQGPLFFGAAQNALRSITTTNKSLRVIMLDMQNVSAMDMTGLVAFESMCLFLSKKQIKLCIFNLSGQPKALIEKSDLKKLFNTYSTLENTISHLTD